MTSITETVAPRRRAGYGLIRPSLLSFVAGVALAGGVAVGVNTLTDGHPASPPVVNTVSTVAPPVHVDPSPDLGCRLDPGPC